MITNPFIKYPLVLGIVSALAGASLYVTYTGTAAARKEQDEITSAKSLDRIFFDTKFSIAKAEKNGVEYMKVWKGEAKKGEEPKAEPDFYAVTGQGIGYNAGKPIVLMVGFANPKKNMPEAGGKDGAVVMGWSVISSEETPGLGENAKSEAAPYTLVEKLSGQAKAPSSDKRTDFQKQFYNPSAKKVFRADELQLKKNGGDIDIITGATYSTNGIISAVKDADARLKKALE